MSDRRYLGPLGAALLAFLRGAPLLAQPYPPPPVEAPPPPPPAVTREQAIEQLRQAIQELREATTNVGQQIQSLEGQLQQAMQAPSATPESAAASSQEIAQLRQQIAELRSQVEEVRTQTTEQNDAILEDVERRAVLAGILSSFLRIPEDQNTYFRAMVVELLVNAQVTPRIRVYGEFEFEDGAGIGEGKGVLEVEQGLGELIVAPALGVRMGIILVPFGKYNRRHEEWRNAYSLRPLVSNIVFPSTYSDVGAELFGALAQSAKFQLSYNVAVTNGLTQDIMTVEGGGRGLRSARPSFGEDNNRGKSFSGRLGLTLGEHVDMGVSGYWGPYANEDAPANWGISFLGADMELSYESVVLRAEGIYSRLDDGFTLIDDDDDPSTPDVESHYPNSLAGAQAEAEVRFWPEFMKTTALGDFPHPVFFVSARFDAVRIAFAHSRQSGTMVSGAIGYRPVQRSAIRLEFAKSFGDLVGGSGGSPAGDSWVASVSMALGF